MTKTVTLSDLRSRPKYVTRLARRKGGVEVIGTDGRVVFRLVIPMTKIR